MTDRVRPLVDEPPVAPAAVGVWSDGGANGPCGARSRVLGSAWSRFVRRRSASAPFVAPPAARRAPTRSSGEAGPAGAGPATPPSGRRLLGSGGDDPRPPRRPDVSELRGGAIVAPRRAPASQVPGTPCALGPLVEPTGGMTAQPEAVAWRAQCADRPACRRRAQKPPSWALARPPASRRHRPSPASPCGRGRRRLRDRPPAAAAGVPRLCGVARLRAVALPASLRGCMSSSSGFGGSAGATGAGAAPARAGPRAPAEPVREAGRRGVALPREELRRPVARRLPHPSRRRLRHSSPRLPRPKRDARTADSPESWAAPDSDAGAAVAVAHRTASAEQNAARPRRTRAKPERPSKSA
jgi:hypothetical protein